MRHAVLALSNGIARALSRRALLCGSAIKLFFIFGCCTYSNALVDLTSFSFTDGAGNIITSGVVGGFVVEYTVGAGEQLSPLLGGNATNIGWRQCAGFTLVDGIKKTKPTTALDCGTVRKVYTDGYTHEPYDFQGSQRDSLPFGEGMLASMLSADTADDHCAVSGAGADGLLLERVSYYTSPPANHWQRNTLVVLLMGSSTNGGSVVVTCATLPNDGGGTIPGGAYKVYAGGHYGVPLAANTLRISVNQVNLVAAVFDTYSVGQTPTYASFSLGASVNGALSSASAHTITIAPAQANSMFQPTQATVAVALVGTGVTTSATQLTFASALEVAIPRGRRLIISAVPGGACAITPTHVIAEDGAEVGATSVLVRAPSQPLTESTAKVVAIANGLQLGGNGYAFGGSSYQVKGLYTYEDSYNGGLYKGMAFFGSGGTPAEMSTVDIAYPKRRLEPTLGPLTTLAAAGDACRISYVDKTYTPVGGPYLSFQSRLTHPIQANSVLTVSAVPGRPGCAIAPTAISTGSSVARAGAGHVLLATPLTSLSGTSVSTYILEFAGKLKRGIPANALLMLSAVAGGPGCSIAPTSVYATGTPTEGGKVSVILATVLTSFASATDKCQLSYTDEFGTLQANVLLRAGTKASTTLTEPDECQISYSAEGALSYPVVFYKEAPVSSTNVEVVEAFTMPTGILHIEFRIYIGALAPGYRGILMTGDTDPQCGNLMVTLYNNQFCFGVQCDTNSDAPTCSTTYVNQNTWYDVKLEKIGTTLQIYVNGELETTATSVTYDYIATTTRIRLGGGNLDDATIEPMTAGTIISKVFFLGRSAVVESVKLRKGVAGTTSGPNVALAPGATATANVGCDGTTGATNANSVLTISLGGTNCEITDSASVYPTFDTVQFSVIVMGNLVAHTLPTPPADSVSYAVTTSADTVPLPCSYDVIVPRLSVAFPVGLSTYAHTRAPAHIEFRFRTSAEGSLRSVHSDTVTVTPNGGAGSIFLPDQVVAVSISGPGVSKTHHRLNFQFPLDVAIPANTLLTISAVVGGVCAISPTSVYTAINRTQAGATSIKLHTPLTILAAATDECEIEYVDPAGTTQSGVVLVKGTTASNTIGCDTTTAATDGASVLIVSLAGDGCTIHSESEFTVRISGAGLSVNPVAGTPVQFTAQTSSDTFPATHQYETFTPVLTMGDLGPYKKQCKSGFNYRSGHTFTTACDELYVNGYRRGFSSIPCESLPGVLPSYFLVLASPLPRAIRENAAVHISAVAGATCAIAPMSVNVTTIETPPGSTSVLLATQLTSVAAASDECEISYVDITGWTATGVLLALGEAAVEVHPCKSTNAYTDDDTCKHFGMDLVVPRSKTHWEQLLARYSVTYFSAMPGVYKTSHGGSYIDRAMHSGTMGNQYTCGNEGSHCQCRGTTFYGKRWLNIASGLEANFDAMLKFPYHAMPMTNPVVVGVQDDTALSCQGTAYFGLLNDPNGGATTFDRMLLHPYKQRDITGTFDCTSAYFHGDPLIGIAKHCFCVPSVECSSTGFGGDPLVGESKRCWCRPADDDFDAGDEYRAIDNGHWWIRDSRYSQPFGDYRKNCWLGLSWNAHGVQDIRPYDDDCSVSTNKYICSYNELGTMAAPSTTTVGSTPSTITFTFTTSQEGALSSTSNNGGPATITIIPSAGANSIFLPDQTGMQMRIHLSGPGIVSGDCTDSTGATDSTSTLTITLLGAKCAVVPAQRAVFNGMHTSALLIVKITGGLSANPPASEITYTAKTSSDTTVSAQGMYSTVAAALLSGTVVPMNLVSGQSGSVAVTFTLSRILPADGKIHITFPIGFGLSSPTISGTPTGLDGTSTLAVLGRTIIISRASATAVAANTAVSLMLLDVVSPVEVGGTFGGSYAITTVDANDNEIETKKDIAPSVIVPPSFATKTVSSSTSIAGSANTITVSIESENAAFAGGDSITIIFGANTFNTASGTLNLAVDTTTYGTTATWDQSTGTLVLVVAVSQGYAIGVLKSVSFEVQNVGHDQDALSPTIMATIAAGANIPSSQMVVNGLNTVRGTLTSASLSVAMLTESEPPASLSVTFTHQSPLTAGNSILVTTNPSVGQLFTNDAADSAACTATTGATPTALAITHNVAASGTVLAVTLGANSPGGDEIVVTCTTNLENNGPVGTTVSYGLEATNCVPISEGTIGYIIRGKVVAVSATPSSLIANVVPASILFAFNTSASGAMTLTSNNGAPATVLIAPSNGASSMFIAGGTPTDVVLAGPGVQNTCTPTYSVDANSVLSLTLAGVACAIGPSSQVLLTVTGASVANVAVGDSQSFTLQTSSDDFPIHSSYSSVPGTILYDILAVTVAAGGTNPLNVILTFTHTTRLAAGDAVVLTTSATSGTVFASDASITCTVSSNGVGIPLQSATISAGGTVLSLIMDGGSGSGNQIIVNCVDNLNHNGAMGTVVTYGLVVANSLPVEVGTTGYTVVGGTITENSLSVTSVIGGSDPGSLVLTFAHEAQLVSGDTIVLSTNASTGKVFTADVATSCTAKTNGVSLTLTTSVVSGTGTILTVELGASSASTAILEVTCTNNLDPNGVIDTAISYAMDVTNCKAVAPGTAGYTVGAGYIMGHSLRVTASTYNTDPQDLVLEFLHQAELVSGNTIIMSTSSKVFTTDGADPSCGGSVAILSSIVSGGGTILTITLGATSSAASQMTITCSENLELNAPSGLTVAYDLVVTNSANVVGASGYTTTGSVTNLVATPNVYTAKVAPSSITFQFQTSAGGSMSFSEIITITPAGGAGNIFVASSTPTSVALTGTGASASCAPTVTIDANSVAIVTLAPNTCAIENNGAVSVTIAGACFVENALVSESPVGFTLSTSVDIVAAARSYSTAKGSITGKSLTVGNLLGGTDPEFMTLTFTHEVRLDSLDTIVLTTSSKVFTADGVNPACTAAGGLTLASSIVSATGTTLTITLGATSATNTQIAVTCADNLDLNAVAGSAVSYGLVVSNTDTTHLGAIGYTTIAGTISAYSLGVTNLLAGTDPAELILTFTHQVAMVSGNSILLVTEPSVFSVDGNDPVCTSSTTPGPTSLVLTSSVVGSNGASLMVILGAESNAGETVVVTCTENLALNGDTGTDITYSLSATNGQTVGAGEAGYSTIDGTITSHSFAPGTLTGGENPQRLNFTFTHEVQMVSGNVVSLKFNTNIFVFNGVDPACTAITGGSASLSLLSSVVGGSTGVAGTVLTLTLGGTSAAGDTVVVSCASNLNVNPPAGSEVRYESMEITNTANICSGAMCTGYTTT